MRSISAQKNTFWIIFILFILLSGMRIIHLGADPPHDLSRSMGYMSDPGGYVFNARNKVVFDEWKMDMWNTRHISPLPLYMTYLSFLLFGTGIAQMNLIPVIFSILILFITYKLFQKNGTEAAALAAVFLLGINFQFTMFSRIAVRVMPMLFFVLLSIYLGKIAMDRQKNYLWIAAGIAAFISFTVKATLFQIFPALLMGAGFYIYFRFSSGIRRVLTSLGLFLTGFGFAGLLWLSIFYFPHKELFQAYGGDNIFWLTPSSINESIQNFWTRPLYYLNGSPVLFSMASLFIIILIYRFFTSPKKITLLEWISGLWMISNLIYYSLIYYRAARHLVPLMVPVVFLAAAALHRMSRIKRLEKPDPPSWPFVIFLFGWMLFPLSNFMIYLKRPVTLESMQNATIKLFIVDGIISSLIFLILKTWPRKWKLRIPRTAPAAAAVILILAASYFNLTPYFRWAARPFYRFQTISRDLGRTYDSMVLGGLIGPILSLENRFEVHPYRTGYINPYDDFIQRFGITHVIPTLHAGAIEKKQYFQNFPQAMRNAVLLARYPLWQTYAELYALDPSPELFPEEMKAYEGETFFGRPGMPRFDEKASRKTALFMGNKHGEILAELPLEEFSSGNYRVRFLIKIEKPDAQNKLICKLDVVDRRRRKLLAYRNLTKENFKNPETYTAFDLPLRIPRNAPISIRVYSPGKTPLLFDYAAISILEKD